MVNLIEAFRLLPPAEVFIDVVVYDRLEPGLE
jgi:hypothetical protein